MTALFSTPRSRLWLDGFERVIIVALFSWLCFRFWNSIDESPANILFLISEGLVAAMVLLRRGTDQISSRPTDWAIGFGGTLLPMLVVPNGAGSNVAAGLLLVGLLISVGAKLSLRRSFGIVAANRGIKRTGLYAVVRHPMYLGYFLSYVGILTLHPSVLNAALLSGWAVLQILRIHAEEKVLMLDPAYQEHARRVRFRLLPLVY